MNRPRLHKGIITLGHRLKFRKIHFMRTQGITHVLTILGKGEGAFDIRNEAKRAGIQWLWLPLETGEPPGKKRLQEINDRYIQL